MFRFGKDICVQTHQIRPLHNNSFEQTNSYYISMLAQMQTNSKVVLILMTVNNVVIII